MLKSIMVSLIQVLSSKLRSKQLRKYNFSEEIVNSESYGMDYALKKQYLLRVKNGYPYDFFDKEIIEIGCGHGGISVFLSVNGAKRVIGIDLNVDHLGVAKKFKEQFGNRLCVEKELPVFFEEMSAYDLKYENNSFDIVIADNVFEHFDKTDLVFKESLRVLKPGGQLIVPSFNAIKSKHGAHLKYGLGIPWVNVFFSEKTICKALSQKAKTEPDLYIAYPGLKNGAETLADLRAYKDLNGMTHKRFVKEAKEAGFQLIRFHVFPPFRFFRFLFAGLYKVEIIRYSWFSDIFSKGASAILIKPLR